MLWHGKNFRGFLNKAKEVLFNNTGTTLQSTNVEDAIKEVNSKLVEYTAIADFQGDSTSGSTVNINTIPYKEFIVKYGYSGNGVQNSVYLRKATLNLSGTNATQLLEMFSGAVVENSIIITNSYITFTSASSLIKATVYAR